MIDIEKERENYETLCKKMGLVRALQKTDGEYVNDHAQTAWGGWLLCVGVKQVEIDSLKVQLEAIKSEKCVWRENEDGVWNTACGQDYIFDSYVAQKPSDSGQYCSNCGKKIEEVSFVESEDE